MFRAVSRSFKVARVSTNFSSSGIAARNFSDKLGIPTDKEQQAGRRKEEMEAEESGSIGFNRDPIIPPQDAGTKENPILVPSTLHRRVVGYEDPFTHQLVWFNLDDGPLHFVPEVNLYFKLQHVH